MNESRPLSKVYDNLLAARWERPTRDGASTGLSYRPGNTRWLPIKPRLAVKSS